MNNKLTQIQMENTNDFNMLIIKPGMLNLDYNDPNYIAKICKLNLFETVLINQSTYLELTTKYLGIPQYQDIAVNVINEVIADEPNYIYELLYVDLEKHKHHQHNENELATMLNINGEKIYSNAIVLKTYIPSLSDSMLLESITINDIERILYKRVHTMCVLYRNYEYVEEHVSDLEEFAKVFFEGEYYKKVELGFLAHNINIWYVSELGETNVCGKLIDSTIEKCIIFTMNTTIYRGNITLKEVKKIIELSNKLESFVLETKDEYRVDNWGRTIVVSKYKILDEYYNKYLQ